LGDNKGTHSHLTNPLMMLLNSLFSYPDFIVQLKCLSIFLKKVKQCDEKISSVLCFINSIIPNWTIQINSANQRYEHVKKFYNGLLKNDDLLKKLEYDTTGSETSVIGTSTNTKGSEGSEGSERLESSVIGTSTNTNTESTESLESLESSVIGTSTSTNTNTKGSEGSKSSESSVIGTNTKGSESSEIDKKLIGFDDIYNSEGGTTKHKRRIRTKTKHKKRRTKRKHKQRRTKHRRTRK
jgi:hypothetical protein